MEHENVSVTVFDQLVSDENGQLLKAMIPYLSFRGQKILAAYAKTQELRNTLRLFSKPHNDMQICSAVSADPMEMLNDIRKFSYGESKKQLDQAINLFAMMQLMQTMNE